MAAFAEIVFEYGRKGLKVMCEGELVTHSWEGDDGKKNYRTEIRILNFEMLGNKQDGGFPDDWPF
mgnify:CR=1 FL=1